ncbi:gamma-glutamyltransferase [candidate division KSB1 bacterium]|nr:gamma-glutamyltransferase [candidate division KSB1 bacterium]
MGAGLAIFVLFAVLVGCSHRPASKAAAPAVPPLDTNFVRSVPVSGHSGMVVSADPLASEIGLGVLKSGGLAVDAAVATLAALNVLEPHASGLGGGGFLLYYDAAHDAFDVIDYRERAPVRTDPRPYFDKSDTLHLVQRAGGTSVCTPGAAAGWQEMHNRYGTRLLRDLFTPALALADTGYPISEKRAAIILEHLSDLQADPNLAAVFLQDSLPPAAGFKIKQPKLGKLLRFLSGTRLTNFYYPPVSTSICNTVAVRGGVLRPDDLTHYAVKDRTPVTGTYHGYEITTLPPPAGGISLLEILKLVEGQDLQGMGLLSAEYIHTLACASRQAQTDMDAWIGDPDFNRVPTDQLLSSSWLDTAAARLRTDTVSDKLIPLDSIHALGPGNTTHVVIVDSLGNLVSITQSINYFFGSGLMAEEWGLLLNNHMADFAADTISARGIAPLHRPPSNMAATIIRQAGRPVLVIGTPGGSRIAPTLAQVIIALLDFGLPLNEALDAPRFFPVRKTLVVESRIPDSTLQALTRKGWRIYPNGPLNNFFGGVQAILIDPDTGVLTGASDPRREGAPAGY